MTNRVEHLANYIHEHNFDDVQFHNCFINYNGKQAMMNDIIVNQKKTNDNIILYRKFGMYEYANIYERYLEHYKRIIKKLNKINDFPEEFYMMNDN